MTPPVYHFDRFSLQDMTTLGRELRHLGMGAACMEDIAEQFVRYFYDCFRDPETGERTIALARCFKTHRYGALDDPMQNIARRSGKCTTLDADVRCLTLLATAGSQPEWNDRHHSRGHKVIPLISRQVVLQFPMIAQLIQQLGLEIESVLDPDPQLLLDLDQQRFNVFHVPQAIGSPYIPAQQDFVLPYGIRSVLGFGSMMPSGDLFAIVLFAKTEIDRSTADRFRSLAIGTKTALLPYDGRKIFRESSLYGARSF